MDDRSVSPEAWALCLAWLGSNPNITTSSLKKIFFSCLFGCDGSSLLHGLSLIAVMGGYLLVMLCRLLVLVASLVAEHRL